jgi:sulfate permease, SulP family
MNASATAQGLRLSMLRGILPFNRSRLPGDIVAGITLAALGIPEVMGYTKISGTPMVTGLYTLLLPVIAFALLGGSRHLVVSADSATAAILASMLILIAPLGSAQYTSLTGLVALLVAGMLVIARVLKLGFLADFLSRSALIGFLTGVGIQVACGELAGLLGLPKEGHGPLGQLVSAVGRVGDAHLASIAMSAAVLAMIVGCSRFAPRVPGALIAVIGAIIASATLDLAAHGIATVGAVPSGLPSFAVPSVHVGNLHQVLVCAASCFIVIIAQSAATSRAYALRYQEPVTDNIDLIGLAAANGVAGLSGTFVVNGSPTKTEMVDGAGGRSQMAHLTTAVVVVIVLLFLTRPLSFLPNAVLSAIVFMIGVKLIDVRGMRELWGLQRNEFWIATVTVATVVVFSVMDGIAVAVALSLIDQVRHTYRPRTRLLVRDASGKWKGVPSAPGQFAAPGILVYRFEANLFYANAGMFMEEILRLVAQSGEGLRGLVLDASGINEIDYSAAKMMLQLRDEVAKRSVAYAVVTSLDEMVEGVRRYGLTGEGRIFATVDAAVNALAAATVAPANNVPLVAITPLPGDRGSLT